MLRTSRRSAAAEDSRSRLMLAAEQLLTREGHGAWSLRRIAQDSGCNSALVAYHFGQLQGLLAAVVDANLTVMIDERTRLLQAVAAGRSNRAKLRAWIESYVRPMWLPCVLGSGGQASVLVDEALALAEGALRGAMIDRINASVAAALPSLRPLLPALPDDVLLLRLRLLLGAAVAAQARPYQQGLLDLRGAAGTPPSEATLEQMLRFVEAALLAA